MRGQSTGWRIAILLAVAGVPLWAPAALDHEAGSVVDTDRLDRARVQAARFLVDCQATDGAWRSDTYGTFKEGGALTGLALLALQTAPTLPEVGMARRKGMEFLAGLVQPDGEIKAGPLGVTYPVYTSSFAVRALSSPDASRYRKERDGWLRFLRERQLTEDLGWQPSDKPYGGWGYCSGLPRKPVPGELAPALLESNLSATVLALEALKAAGVRSGDPAFNKALVFVKRCQNCGDDPKLSDPGFDDGGFFFIYDDAVRNKAGVIGKDRHGRERFASYGSMTADGLRALLACGLPAVDPRVKAGTAWLLQNFRADAPPGKYAANRESSRSSVYYYYCASVAQAFKAIEANASNHSPFPWVKRLSDELLKRQQPNGSWTNPLVAQREDDPVVATAFALIGLSTCRESTRE
jgi:squalene-hopene/tetraprenyl-beta-curcumene cyclase